jgi:2-polyprenyl-6-methoxyphenol hydroxylase-like FAD-dependent oxidoreductase
MTQQQFPTSTDVLIVGAGPAGMTLAIGLKQPPMDCVSIDQLPDNFRRTLAATA